MKANTKSCNKLPTSNENKNQCQAHLSPVSGPRHHKETDTGPSAGSAPWAYPHTALRGHWDFHPPLNICSITTSALLSVQIIWLSVKEAEESRGQRTLRSWGSSHSLPTPSFIFPFRDILTDCLALSVWPFRPWSCKYSVFRSGFIY